MVVQDVYFKDTDKTSQFNAQVFLRAAWADAWELEPYLIPLEIVWSVAPAMPTATLRWDYGYIMREDEPESGFSKILKEESWGRYYVKIAAQWDQIGVGYKYWYGILDVNEDAHMGTMKNPDQVAGGTVSTGRQHFTCFGMEKLLADHTVDSMHWVKQDGTTVVIGDRPYGFNESGTFNRSENQHSVIGPDGVQVLGTSFVFEGNPKKLFPWSALTAIQYLMTTQTPKNQAGTRAVPFVVDPALKGTNWDKIEIRQERTTTYNLLHQLMPRERLFMWWLEVDEFVEPNNVVLKNETMNAADISIDLPGAGVLAANASQRRYIASDDPFTGVGIKYTQIPKYDQVVLRGQRRVSVGTFNAYYDSDLEQGWTVAQEDDYKTGVQATQRYINATSETEEIQITEEYRGRPELRNVYSFIVPPADWDQRVRDGRGGATFPMFPSDADPAVPANNYAAGQRFLPVLPFLLEGVDYSGGVIPNRQVPGQSPTERVLSAQVFFEIPGKTGEFIRGEDIQSTIAVESDNEREASFTASVRPAEESLGFYLEAVGAPPHVVVGQTYTLGEENDVVRSDWRWENAVFTLAIEDDRYVEGVYPSFAGIGATQTVRRKIIDAGETYAQVYYPQGTVIGIGLEGELLKVGIDPNDGTEYGGGYIPPRVADSAEQGADRDPTWILQELSKMAGAWYTVDHAVLSVTTNRIFSDLQVKLGDLVVDYGVPAVDGDHVAVGINSPVTQITIRYEVVEDSSDPPLLEMQIETFSGEFDAMGFAKGMILR